LPAPSSILEAAPKIKKVENDDKEAEATPEDDAKADDDEKASPSEDKKEEEQEKDENKSFKDKMMSLKVKMIEKFNYILSNGFSGFSEASVGALNDVEKEVDNKDKIGSYFKLILLIALVIWLFMSVVYSNFDSLANSTLISQSLNLNRVTNITYPMNA